MAWDTPKTDWGVDVVGSADFNRIEENIAVLHKGNGQTSLQVIAGSESLNIGVTDETFVITGSSPSVSIKYIYVGTRQPGNKIRLILSDTPDLIHNEGSVPTGYAALFLTNTSSASNYHASVTTAPCDNQTIDFTYDGTWWRSGIIIQP